MLWLFKRVKLKLLQKKTKKISNRGEISFGFLYPSFKQTYRYAPSEPNSAFSKTAGVYSK